jgi:hypothetical protein
MNMAGELDDRWLALGSLVRRDDLRLLAAPQGKREESPDTVMGNAPGNARGRRGKAGPRFGGATASRKVPQKTDRRERELL